MVQGPPTSITWPPPMSHVPSLMDDDDDDDASSVGAPRSSQSKLVVGSTMMEDALASPSVGDPLSPERESSYVSFGAASPAGVAATEVDTATTFPGDEDLRPQKSSETGDILSTENEENEHSEPSADTKRMELPSKNDKDDDDCCPCEQALVEAEVRNQTTDNDKNEDESTQPPFQMGDHVFQWCSLGGIPAVYQHHAIVMDVSFKVFSADDENDDDESDYDVRQRDRASSETSSQAPPAEWVLHVADFSNRVPEQAGGPRKRLLFSGSQRRYKGRCQGCLRTYETPITHWKRVQYGAKVWKNMLSRPGTWSSTTCDAPGLVRARVQFLLERGVELLPAYDSLTANCECVAVWCKTGTWATLQTVSWLTSATASQLKSTALLTGAAAATPVTITAPAAGVWGWMGYTTSTQVSLLAAQPVVGTVLVAYGAVTVGVPAVVLLRARGRWKQTTAALNTAFWESAVAQPDVFVELITHWSSNTNSSNQDTSLTLAREEDTWSMASTATTTQLSSHGDNTVSAEKVAACRTNDDEVLTPASAAEDQQESARGQSETSAATRAAVEAAKG